MKEYKIPAIVFGGGINGLGVARNLGKERVDVYCVVDGVDSVVFSKFCKRHFLVPNFRERKDLVRLFLRKFSKNVADRAVIFATDDVSTLLLSGLQHETKDGFHFVVPELRVAEKLILKRKFYESLIENKVPHPRVILPLSGDHVKKVSKEVEYPIFIKPSISPYFSKVFRRKGFVANSESELVKYYNLAVKHNIDVIFQEIIPGSDRQMYGISGYFNRKSKPMALFAYHRIRGWPNMFGTSSLIESIAISEHPRLKEIVTKYLTRLSYFGIMEAEFKLDPRDNEFKLLEINARSWWQNSLPTRCGLNIVLKAYLDAIGEEVEYSETYAPSMRWVNLRDDIRSSTSSKEIVTRGWLGSYKKVRSFAFFDIDDPIPCVANYILETRRLFS
jgi:predicted ATP-grasp superfamily ATP-dependent carboligase